MKSRMPKPCPWPIAESVLSTSSSSVPWTTTSGDSDMADELEWGINDLNRLGYRETINSLNHLGQERRHLCASGAYERHCLQEGVAVGSGASLRWDSRCHRGAATAPSPDA